MKQLTDRASRMWSHWSVGGRFPFTDSLSLIQIIYFYIFTIEVDLETYGFLTLELSTKATSSLDLSVSFASTFSDEIVFSVLMKGILILLLPSLF